MEHQMYPQEERPPMQPPMKPPMYPQMKPPMQRPMRPPMYQPPMQDYYYPGKKRIFPKPNFVQINIGGPQPYGYHIPKMIPHGPKHLFVPHGMGYRRPVDPVGEIIDFVADPVGYMVEKSLGLRSNKPKGKEGEKKDGEKKEENKEETKEEKKEIKVENEGDGNKEPVLRARKMGTEEQEDAGYEEVEYAEEKENIQQEQQAQQEQQIQQEGLCPECTGESLCPNCANGESLCPECSGQNVNENLCQECDGENYPQNINENLCPECSGVNINENTYQNLCPECSGENVCPDCNNKLKYKTNKASQFNNFSFHEIVETSDNKKSVVVVKKGGVVISGN